MSQGISCLKSTFILAQRPQHFKPTSWEFSLRVKSRLVTLMAAMEFAFPKMGEPPDRFSADDSYE